MLAHKRLRFISNLGCEQKTISPGARKRRYRPKAVELKLDIYLTLDFKVQIQENSVSQRYDSQPYSYRLVRVSLN